MKIALVHDYLQVYGGAERVLEELHALYPQAPVYVAFFDQKALGIHAQKFAGWDIRQSFITKIPLYKIIYSPLRLFAPKFFSAFDMSEYDVILSSSNMYFAKAIKKRTDAIHISYCHTPPRALYGYTTQTNWKKNPIIRLVGTLINHYLRVVDYNVSQQVDYFIANSHEVQKRIQKYYRKDSTIIYPPVNVAEKLSTQKNSNADYYLYVGRLAFSKHPELAVKVANKLQLKLKVVGTGSMMDQLKQIAGETVELLGSVDDYNLNQVYQGAKGLIFPVKDEDFGIVPVEAMGHAVPVIAHNSGGPKETVIDGVTGVLFDQLTEAGLTKAIQRFTKIKFDPQQIHQQALKFSTPRFKKEIANFVTTHRPE